MTWDASVYAENVGDNFAWADSCVRPNKDFEPQPNVCTKWETSDDGLTWTFNLEKDKVWSDGKPITADDLVFTLQRFARPDYDFEWFYGMMNIDNWSKVVSGEEAGRGAGRQEGGRLHLLRDDRSADAVPGSRSSADLWVTPKHIVKDRLERWHVGASSQNNWVFAGPYKLESYDKGKAVGLCRQRQVHRPLPAA